MPTAFVDQQLIDIGCKVKPLLAKAASSCCWLMVNSQSSSWHFSIFKYSMTNPLHNIVKEFDWLEQSKECLLTKMTCLWEFWQKLLYLVFISSKKWVGTTLRTMMTMAKIMVTRMAGRQHQQGNVKVIVTVATAQHWWNNNAMMAMAMTSQGWQHWQQQCYVMAQQQQQWQQWGHKGGSKSRNDMATATAMPHWWCNSDSGDNLTATAGTMIT